jgi:hypothetical protein
MALLCRQRTRLRRELRPPHRAEGVVQNRLFLGDKLACGSSRALQAGPWSAGLLCRGEAASLPGSGVLVLKRSEAEQGEPVRMAFAGHQFPRALADALGKPAAHEAPMVQEEPQQIQIRAAQMATQGEVVNPSYGFLTGSKQRSALAAGD